MVEKQRDEKTDKLTDRQADNQTNKQTNKKISSAGGRILDLSPSWAPAGIFAAESPRVSVCGFHVGVSCLLVLFAGGSCVDGLTD